MADECTHQDIRCVLNSKRHEHYCLGCGEIIAEPALPTVIAVRCEGSGHQPRESHCQVCGQVPFLIQNNLMPEHQRRHVPLEATP